MNRTIYLDEMSLHCICETFFISLLKLLTLHRTSSATLNRTSPLVHVKEEPLSPTYSSEVEEVCPVEVEVGAGSTLPADTPLSPTTFINSILQESEPSPAPPPPEKCLSVARLDKWVWIILRDHTPPHHHLQKTKQKKQPPLQYCKWLCIRLIKLR